MAAGLLNNHEKINIILYHAYGNFKSHFDQ